MKKYISPSSLTKQRASQTPSIQEIKSFLNQYTEYFPPPFLIALPQITIQKKTNGRWALNKDVDRLDKDTRKEIFMFLAGSLISFFIHPPKETHATKAFIRGAYYFRCNNHAINIKHTEINTPFKPFMTIFYHPNGTLEITNTFPKLALKSIIETLHIFHTCRKKNVPKLTYNPTIIENEIKELLPRHWNSLSDKYKSGIIQEYPGLAHQYDTPPIQNPPESPIKFKTILRFLKILEIYSLLEFPERRKKQKVYFGIFRATFYKEKKVKIKLPHTTRHIELNATPPKPTRDYSNSLHHGQLTRLIQALREYREYKARQKSVINPIPTKTF